MACTERTYTLLREGSCAVWMVSTCDSWAIRASRASRPWFASALSAPEGQRHQFSARKQRRSRGLQQRGEAAAESQVGTVKGHRCLQYNKPGSLEVGRDGAGDGLVPVRQTRTCQHCFSL